MVCRRSLGLLPEGSAYDRAVLGAADRLHECDVMVGWKDAQSGGRWDGQCPVLLSVRAVAGRILLEPEAARERIPQIEASDQFRRAASGDADVLETRHPPEAMMAR